MRKVMGLSLTATSAVWVLLDTRDGSLIASELVAIGARNEVALAAARSVQNFATQNIDSIDAIGVTWSDDARAHGIRLRTKLRLFGFEAVHTVPLAAARAARRRAAHPGSPHVAPHLALARGAARATVELESSEDAVRHRARRTTAWIGGAASIAAAVGIAVVAIPGSSPLPETPATAATAPSTAAPAVAPSRVPVPTAEPVTLSVPDSDIESVPDSDIESVPDSDIESVPDPDVEPIAEVTEDEVTGPDLQPNWETPPQPASVLAPEDAASVPTPAVDVSPQPVDDSTDVPHLPLSPDGAPLSTPVPGAVAPLATEPSAMSAAMPPGAPPATEEPTRGPIGAMLGALP